MSSTAHHRFLEHRSQSPSSGGRVGRRALIWLLAPLLLVGAMCAILYYVHAQGAVAVARSPVRPAQAHSAPMQPADWFMQSVVTDDGALGWRQLCPSIQAQLPVDTLVQQANAQRTAAAQQGVRLTMEFKGTHPQRGGGDIHVYLVTAHWPNGATQQRTFSVLTQPGGCVADVQSADVQSQ